MDPLSSLRFSTMSSSILKRKTTVSARFRG
jgi:hypothetical protein